MEAPQKKLKTELPHDPAISLWGIYSKTMYIAEVFTAAKIQKQTKCLVIDEKIKKT